ncbi:hypothetical protein IJJ39_02750 [Candidatus Saccharibacteria bacterium]|nr:hypothetical protein [Candidatus Saccharibacteria bacterium]
MGKQSSSRKKPPEGPSRTRVARARRHGARALPLGRNLRSVLKEPSGGSSPHRSFKRSYREDYVRELNVPGMGQHIYETFKMFCMNWKIFVPFLVLVGILEAIVTQLTYETTAVFTILIFLMIWLTTIFLVRHIKAGHKVTLRDGLYNAMTPLLSSLVVFVVIVVECIPLFLLIIAYSAAVETEFLTMPFYALLFFGFAGLMLTLSGYLTSSSLISLLAVSAPGMYPLKALMTAADLMMGRRIRFILRIIALLMMIGVICAVCVVPLAIMKVPMEVISVIATFAGCFSAIYATIYLYLYYRYLLDA